MRLTGKGLAVGGGARVAPVGAGSVRAETKDNLQGRPRNVQGEPEQGQGEEAGGKAGRFAPAFPPRALVAPGRAGFRPRTAA